MNDKIWFYGYGQYKVFTNRSKVMKRLEDIGLKTSCEYHLNCVKIGEDFIFEAEKLNKVKGIIK